VINLIQVYDIQSKSFRDINYSTNNPGFVLFNRSAISIIEQHYNICGFFYLDRSRRKINLIDINDSTIAIPEYSFIEMADTCKSNLEKYNITDRVDFHFSLGFINLYIEGKDCNTSDYFTSLCFDIMHNIRLLNTFAIINASIIYPISTQELYAFAQNVYKLTSFDYITPDYDTNFKYVIDGLINGYHINFSEDDVRKYAYNISQLAYEKVAERHE